MRDILMALIVLGSLPFILQRPYIGILVWSWLSYMNPHRFTWSWAYDAPWAQIVAITLLVAILFSKDKKTLPMNGTVRLWLVFIVWMGVTTSFAFFPDSAMVVYIKILKIQLITFLTLLLITDQDKLDKLIWVIVGSLGYFTIKGGLFTLVTGGAHKVYGPPESYIYENNSLALATLMVIPLMVYLATIAKDNRIRLILWATVGLSFISAVGSQSRGALLAIIFVLFFFWLKTKTKLVSGIAIAMFVIVGWNFMPESWHERMDTIRNYEEDESAMSRINAWTYSINVANDRITGAGLQSWRSRTFAIYAPDPEDVVAAHSIYFAILADHGWIGLSMFLFILFLTWRRLAWIIKTTADEADKKLNLLARMLQISLVAYMSGGAFLSLAYFDLPWHLIAMVVMLGSWHEKNIAGQASSLTGRPGYRAVSVSKQSQRG